jgi:hypothetical protein
MKALVAVEAWCAAAVERAFAVTFGGAIEPVQIARRLVATIESAPPARDDAAPTRYVVRVGAADFRRLDAERADLERLWTHMAGTLCARAGAAPAQPPVVVIVQDDALVAGTVAVGVERPQPGGPAPAALALRVALGPGAGTAFALPRPGSGPRPVIVGRDAACDVALSDPRVSRRHVRCTVVDDGVAFEDLGSSNGTYVNGERRAAGVLRAGDLLEVGDTALRVEPA